MLAQPRAARRVAGDRARVGGRPRAAGCRCDAGAHRPAHARDRRRRLRRALVRRLDVVRPRQRGRSALLCAGWLAGRGPLRREPRRRRRRDRRAACAPGVRDRRARRRRRARCSSRSTAAWARLASRCARQTLRRRARRARAKEIDTARGRRAGTPRDLNPLVVEPLFDLAVIETKAGATPRARGARCEDAVQAAAGQPAHVAATRRVRARRRQAPRAATTTSRGARRRALEARAVPRPARTRHRAVISSLPAVDTPGAAPRQRSSGQSADRAPSPSARRWRPLAAPAGARASPTQESTFQDDDLLVYARPTRSRATLDRMKALGADRVRVSVFWSSSRPRRTTPSKPAGFDAADPGAYPTGAWDRYDTVVREAAARGIGVNFNLTAPAPMLGDGQPAAGGHRRDATSPTPAEFGALRARRRATRYSGSYSGLPRVEYWAIWNEPNQPRLADAAVGPGPAQAAALGRARAGAVPRARRRRVGRAAGPATAATRSSSARPRPRA